MASDHDETETEAEAQANSPDALDAPRPTANPAANLAEALHEDARPPAQVALVRDMVERVKMLAQALAGSDVSELDLTEDGARILIRRQLEAGPGRAGGRLRGRAGGTRSAPSETQAAPAPEGIAQGIAQGIAIVAPLTGVYYGSPSPSSPPFVAVGDTVQAGQVVCIVEAMKVFNDIKSEISGTVTTIVAQNGNLVQKGEALIRVKPI